MTKTVQALGIAAVVLALQLPARANCPVADGATVVVHAPIGNLQIDTGGRDVDVEVVGKNIVAKEVLCSKDRVEYTADTTGQIKGSIDWKIVVPRSVNLDLVTLGGSIHMGDSDGWAKLRTNGGSITVGRIKGKAAIITQGGFIKAGDIGDDAELRSSSAGSLEVGNIAGDADLHTAGGPITTGNINGKIVADSGGGKIYIKGARGDVFVKTEAGEIFVGDAARINAKTAGGGITAQKVRGPAQMHTESGDIRLESAGSWVEASTGSGTIYVKLAPENLDGDLHMDLNAAGGDVTIYIPERIRANVDATIERSPSTAQRIFSEFPMTAYAASRSLVQRALSSSTPIAPPVNNRFMSVPLRETSAINGGGSSIRLRTTMGKIEIFKVRK